MIPSLAFTADERATNALQQRTIETAVKQFQASGCLLLENVFSALFIQELDTVYAERYGHYYQAEKHADALNVGHRRFLITVGFQLPFNTPQLYANPLVLPIIESILDNDCVLGSLASVVSLPGAALQHAHADYSPLFPSFPSRLLPSYALTLFIPLVELNDFHGTTRIWPGSHRSGNQEQLQADFVDPQVPLGSCVLMDYRVLHQGTENRAEIPRPILYLVYHRPWFKDYKNYKKQPFLLLTESERQRIPEQHRRLIRWVDHYRTGLF
jgi:hypothetical protein